MPRYSLVLYNQRHRVRYPETLSLPDVDAAQRVARRVANVFMEVVPYWGDLTPDQQGRYVVEIVGEAGELLLTVPFRERTRRTLGRLKRSARKRKSPTRMAYLMGLVSSGSNGLSLTDHLDGSVRRHIEAVWWSPSPISQPPFPASGECIGSTSVDHGVH